MSDAMLLQALDLALAILPAAGILCALVESIRYRSGILKFLRDSALVLAAWLFLLYILLQAGVPAPSWLVLNQSALITWSIILLVLAAGLNSATEKASLARDVVSGLSGFFSGVFWSSLGILILLYILEAFGVIVLPQKLENILASLIAVSIVAGVVFWGLGYAHSPERIAELMVTRGEEFINLRARDIRLSALTIHVPNGALVVLGGRKDESYLYLYHPELEYSVSFRHGEVSGRAEELIVMAPKNRILRLSENLELDRALEEDFIDLGIKRDDIKERVISLLGDRKKSLSVVKMPFIEVVEGPGFEFVRVGPITVIERGSSSSVKIGTFTIDEECSIQVIIRDYDKGLVKIALDGGIVYRDSAKKIIDDGKQFIAKTRKRKVILRDNLKVLKSEGVKIVLTGNSLKVSFDDTKISAARSPPVIKIYKEGELVEKRLDSEAVERAFERAKSLILKVVRAIVREEPLERVRFSLD